MKVSVVIPNRNDTVMLAITVRNIVEELKAVGGDSEVVICDNSDADIWGVLKTPNVSPLDLSLVQEEKVRLIRQPFPGLFTARETAIKEAQGEYVINTDSHTMYGRDTLRDLIHWMDTTTTNVGFGYCPIGWVSAPENYARHDIRPENDTIYGPWGRQYYEPTKICWNFGSFICKRDWFLNDLGGHGFFDRKRVSWGGGEFYVAIKSWLFGKENWAIPSAPQYHFGPWSSGVQRVSGCKYRLYGKSGEGKTSIGLLAALYALAGEFGRDYLKRNPNSVGQYGIDIDSDWGEAKRLAERDRRFILENQTISFEQLVEQKPWMEDWSDDRWESWQPQNEINIRFPLGKL